MPNDDQNGTQGVVTTLAIGEETGPGFDPPAPDPGSPDVTTLAIGEESGPSPIDWPIAWEPGPGEATTLALGEEGPPLDGDGWLF